MKLKDLIKEVERLNEVKDEPVAIATRNKLEGIKETVETVDNLYMNSGYSKEFSKNLWGDDVIEWAKLKKLLEIKAHKKT